MEAQIIAAIILVPITFVFLYAGIHEFRRFKSDGRANYGLVYDEETGTTHVTGIAEGEDSYDLEEYDPNNYNDTEVSREDGEDDEKS